MKIAQIAFALFLAAPATMAFAQDFNAADMMSGYSMIEANAASAFKQYGIDADPMALTLSQLGEIVAILNDPDKNSDGESAKRSIMAAISRN